jgi:hypothetical protein
MSIHSGNWNLTEKGEYGKITTSEQPETLFNITTIHLEIMDTTLICLASDLDKSKNKQYST